jgi:hypothetical protein
MAGAADTRAATVTLNAAEDDDLGNLEFLAAGDNGFIQWLAVPAIVLAKVHAQHASGKLFLHACPHSLIIDAVFRLVCVLHDVHIREHNQSLLHHLIDDEEKGVQLFIGIDGREHDRAVMG